MPNSRPNSAAKYRSSRRRENGSSSDCRNGSIEASDLEPQYLRRLARLPCDGATVSCPRLFEGRWLRHDDNTEPPTYQSLGPRDGHREV